MSLKLRNKSYSLRAFARRLDISSGALSQILNGQRKVSVQRALKLIEKLGLSPDKMNEIETLFNVNKVKSKDLAESRKILQLKSDQFKLICDGIHYSLLCLIETSDFRYDLAWIAERLNAPEVEVKNAVDRLQRLGLIEIKNGTELKLTGIQLATTDDIPSDAIKKFHIDRLEEAQEKLLTTEVKDRYFFSTTYAVDKNKMNEAKKLIKNFFSDLHQLLEQDNIQKNEVYRFNLQFLPVSNLKK